MLLRQTAKEFLNKVVLVTGAGGGIGAATAINFAKLGAILSLTDIDRKNLQIVGAICAEIGMKKPILIPADVTKTSDIKRIIEATVRSSGKLDILINNVGILQFDSIDNTTIKIYDQIFSVNVRSIFELTLTAVPHLAETKGSIVNVSSVLGLRSFPGCLSYCMSKSALDQFTKCAAFDLRSKGIRVNSVNPGTITSDMYAKAGMTAQQVQDFYSRESQTNLRGRLGKTNDAAQAIMFLASNRADFITGTLLTVDGGWHNVNPF